jgi:ABC-type transport system involved in multi-copper enzyme maturation permease subunit
VSLARAERRRLFKRRFTRYMLLLVLGVLATVAIVTFVNNQKTGPAQLAAAERAADRVYQQQARFAHQARQACERDKAAGANTDGEWPPNCSELTGPSRDQIDSRQYLPPTFDFRKDFERTITILAGILALFAFVVGASYVGAEWHTGGMMNLLLWRPRRLTVLLTKLGTLLTALLGLFVGLAVAWAAVFWGIATFRGSTDRMTSGVWQSFALTGLRGLGLVVIAGVIGFGLASIGRHTALALGAAVGVGVVGQIGVGIALNLIDISFVERWVWPSYLQAWMDKRLVLHTWDRCDFSLSGCRPQEYVMTWQQSAVVFAVATAVVLAGALWMMRRRDIT